MIPLLHSHNAVQVKHTSELAYFIRAEVLIPRRLRRNKGY